MKDRMKMVRELQSTMATNPAGLSRQKGSTGKRLTPAERAKAKKQREKDERKRKRDQKRGRDGGNGEA
jgi:signal recognition particle subunit SRP54